MSRPENRVRIPLRRRALVLGPVLALYALSLVTAAEYFTPRSNERVWHGSDFLGCGCWGPLGQPPLVAWYANPLLALACVWLARSRPGRASLAAAFGLLVALDSLRLRHIGLAPNEGGVVTHHFLAFGPGYYLWLASFVAMVVGALALALAYPRGKAPP